MKLSYTYFIIILTLFLRSGFSQTMYFDEFRKKNSIHIGIPSLITGYNPSARIGYEIKPTKYFGVQLGLGFAYNLNGKQIRHKTSSENIGYIFNTELRIYPSKGMEVNDGVFYGLRGFYLDSDMTKEFWFVPEPPPGEDYIAIKKYCRQEKEIRSLEVIVGIRGGVDYLYFEWVAGLGISYRKVNNNVDKKLGPPGLQDWSAISEFFNKDYDGWQFPYPCLQLRMGYRW